VGKFSKLAATEKSGLVRLYLASALQRLEISQRTALAKALATHNEDADDHNIPLMIWYGFEPVVDKYPEAALEIVESSQIPKLRAFIARRLTEDLEKKPAPVNQLIELSAKNFS